MKWVKGITAVIILTCFFSIVNNMDHRIEQKELAWKKSVQALLMEQERIEQEIIKMQEQIDSHNLLIWDIRDRVHLDLGWEIENE